jgi:D-amino-acid dehydrogenase
MIAEAYKSILSTATHRQKPCDVIVLGAGVVGVSTAYALARRGLSVTLVDREMGPARGASFANGAQLSYAYSDTLGSPALLKKLPGLALGSDPLFRLKPSLDPDFLRWSFKFLAACTNGSQRAGTLATLKLALESQLALHALLKHHALEFSHTIAGKMHLYFDCGALSNAARMVALKQANGATQHVLTAQEAIRIEPALAGAAHLKGVVYSPNDEVGDPYKFSTGLVQILVEQYGVRAQLGMKAHDVRFEAGGVSVAGEDGELVNGRSLVVALGIGAPSFLARMGIHVPIQPLKGYSFTAPPGALAPQVSLTDTARKLVFCNLSGRIRVAGVAELGVWNTRPIPARLASLVTSARDSLPQAADFANLDSSWVGLRPMSPTSVPIISRPHPRLVLNVGHGMLGWTLAMGAGERAASLVLQDQGFAPHQGTTYDAA